MTCFCTTYGVCEPCNIQRLREHARTFDEAMEDVKRTLRETSSNIAEFASPGPPTAAKAPAPASGVGGPVVRPAPLSRAPHAQSPLPGGGAGTQPEGEA